MADFLLPTSILFVNNHNFDIDDISIYGRESNQTTYRLCRMNPAIRSIDCSNACWNDEGLSI